MRCFLKLSGCCPTMSADLLQLVTDTLAFIREDGPAPSFVPAKQALPKPPVSEKIEKPQPKATPQVTPSPVKQSSSLFEKIQKHLPHLKLIQEIPPMKQVALVVFNKEDLPFLKTLKRAIQTRFCPVKWIDGSKSDQIANWDQFELVLSQKQVPAQRQIVLASIATYQNNTEQKKLLWSTLCHYLSPKSS